MEKTDGSAIEIVTLRSPEWMEETRCEVGGEVWLELNAIGLADWAQVRAIEPCAPIKSRPGRVVTSTITQMAPSVMEIKFSGQEEALCPTASHRLFSATRHDWVQAGDLVAGEELLTRDGVVRVDSVSLQFGDTRVYNLEVETDHCYFTGHEQVLSHNACPNDWVSPKEFASDLKSQLYKDIKASLPNMEQGQHGIIDIRVGNRLIQEANELAKKGALPEVVDALKIEGKRLINRGNSISHKN